MTSIRAYEALPKDARYEKELRLLNDYLAKQLSSDLRRCGLHAFQPADMDDLKQDLAAHYFEQVLVKKNYLQSANARKYLFRVLQNRLSHWAKELRRHQTHMNSKLAYTLQRTNRTRGHIDISAPIFNGLTVRSKIIVIARYYANFSIKQIAQAFRLSEDAVHKILQRANRIMFSNL